MALGNRHCPAGVPVGLGNSVLMALALVRSAPRLSTGLLEVPVILRLQPFVAGQIKPVVAGQAFTSVYFSLLYALRLEPEDREVLRAFQRKFNRWRI